MILRDQGPARLPRTPEASLRRSTTTHLRKAPQQLRDHHPQRASARLPTTLKYIIASRALEDNQYVSCWLWINVKYCQTPTLSPTYVIKLAAWLAHTRPTPGLPQGVTRGSSRSHQKLLKESPEAPQGVTRGSNRSHQHLIWSQQGITGRVTKHSGGAQRVSPSWTRLQPSAKESLYEKEKKKRRRKN